MKKFEKSELAEDTIIIFTTDHATYQDDSFVKAFPDWFRAYTFCDEIPLWIYYKGITTEIIDVKGRNTLGLAPTILDYLDISAPNYFLGRSLFVPEANSSFETYFTESFVYLDTKDGEIRYLSEEEKNIFIAMLQDYFYITSLGE